MPTYEYLCKNCKHELETVQSIKDDPIKTCPNCEKDCLERLVSGGTSFSLKGGGWYKDLYSTPNPSKN